MQWQEDPWVSTQLASLHRQQADARALRFSKQAPPAPEPTHAATLPTCLFERLLLCRGAHQLPLLAVCQRRRGRGVLLKLRLQREQLPLLGRCCRRLRLQLRLLLRALAGERLHLLLQLRDSRVAGACTWLPCRHAWLLCRQGHKVGEAVVAPALCILLGPRRRWLRRRRRWLARSERSGSRSSYRGRVTREERSCRL